LNAVTQKAAYLYLLNSKRKDEKERLYETERIFGFHGNAEALVGEYIMFSMAKRGRVRSNYDQEQQRLLQGNSISDVWEWKPVHHHTFIHIRIRYPLKVSIY